MVQFEVRIFRARDWHAMAIIFVACDDSSNSGKEGKRTSRTISFCFAILAVLPTSIVRRQPPHRHHCGVPGGDAAGEDVPMNECRREGKFLPLSVGCPVYCLPRSPCFRTATRPPYATPPPPRMQGCTTSNHRSHLTSRMTWRLLVARTRMG